MNKQTQERWTRLQIFFASEAWADLKEEINICHDNADVQLKAKDCDERNYFAGKCAGVQEILNLKNKCRVKE